MTLIPLKIFFFIFKRKARFNISNHNSAIRLNMLYNAVIIACLSGEDKLFIFNYQHLTIFIWFRDTDASSTHLRSAPVSLPTFSIFCFCWFFKEYEHLCAHHFLLFVFATIFFITDENKKHPFLNNLIDWYSHPHHY